MNQNNLNLTQDDILEKEFKIDTRGYRLKEVDQFLDLIIADYGTFIDVIRRQEAEKDKLSEEVLRLKKELRDASYNAEKLQATSSTGNISNVDILKRISNLEKVIFGKNE
ncbi:MAG: cell division regulator GpsB [bacterium]|nr:cell division regulator GpsB [bacterium]